MSHSVLSGLNDSVWKWSKPSDGDDLSLALVRQAAGTTPDDLTEAEADAFLRSYQPRITGGPEFRSREHFLTFAQDAVAGFLERRGLLPREARPLTLSDMDAGAYYYLRGQLLPTEPVSFEAYLRDLRESHRSKIDEGLHDMIGDCFVASLPEDLRRAYLSPIYEAIERIPLSEFTPPRVRDLAGRALLPEMLNVFQTALDSDLDVRRRDLIGSQIEAMIDATGLSRSEAMRCLLEEVLEGYLRYIHPENMHITDDSYRYAEHGLRTTSAIYLSAAHTQFMGSPEGRRAFPAHIQKVGIIGPGLEFVEFLQGSRVSRQMYEPFVMVDAMIRNRLVDPKTVQFDLIDINPEVIAHIEEARRRAERDEEYVLSFSVSAFHARSQIVMDHFSNFGTSIPGAVLGPIERRSDGSISRTVRIPPEIVLRMNPVLADMTADHFSPDGRYDLMMCFNTMVYLNEEERTMAGINIRRALREGGVFWTDNRFETDSGERVESPMPLRVPDPIFDDSYLDLFVDESLWLFPATLASRPSMKQVMEFYRRPPQIF